MSTWGFNRESTQTVNGANNAAAQVAGYQPYAQADYLASKRNVVATNKGWVRRQIKTDMHGTTRTIDEVLVAANPGVQGMDYASNNYLGDSDISQVYVKLNANGYISANVSANLYVVFNTPLHFKASGNLCSISIANTVGGNHGLAYFANTAAQSRIINANNTLVFKMPALQGGAGSVAATYHVNAQAISVTGNPLYNPDKGITHTANLTITGAVSNNMLNGAGALVTNFQVARPAGQV